jgi:hypothetical protein
MRFSPPKWRLGVGAAGSIDILIVGDTDGYVQQTGCSPYDGYYVEISERGVIVATVVRVDV